MWIPDRSQTSSAVARLGRKGLPREPWKIKVRMPEYQRRLNRQPLRRPVAVQRLECRGSPARDGAIYARISFHKRRVQYGLRTRVNCSGCRGGRQAFC